MRRADVGFVVTLVVFVALFSGISVECNGQRYSITPVEKGCCR